MSSDRASHDGPSRNETPGGGLQSRAGRFALCRFVRWCSRAVFAGVDLELLDQTAEVRGSLHQLLRRLLCSWLLASCPRRLRHARNVAVISPLPWAASLTLRDISLVVAFCSSTAVAIVREILLIWSMTALMMAMASTAALGVSLDRFDLAADVFGGLGGLLGQFFHFVGYDSEALARLLPARAASMVAFEASRLVCCAMEVMTLMT